MNTRAQAVLIIRQVITERFSLNSALAIWQSSQTSQSQHTTFSANHDARDSALIQKLCYGTLRWYYRLTMIAKQLLLSPLKSKHQDIFILLLVGLYQLLYTRTPTYAVVAETVNAARTLNKSWACALLNKTLRLFLRDQSKWLLAVNKNLEGRYAHPRWLINLIKQHYPCQWEEILTANNHHPPLILRVNRQKISREHYLTLLKEQQIAATPIATLTNAVQLTHPLPINQLPGFQAGLVYIQDSAGQYAAPLLDLQPQHRVLDACAAPGSKTTHILEAEPNVQSIVALDKNPGRMNKILANLDRLGLSQYNIKVFAADAGCPDHWWDGSHFDRILLDAPCSASGIIRRHPDIKLLRREHDITQHTKQQLKLLHALWPLLKPAGLLLYCTCSILPEENEQIIANFITQRDDASTLPLAINDGIRLPHGRQLLPQVDGHDGFYYALLLKV